MRLSLLALTIAASTATAQDAVPQEWIVQAHYPDRAALARAAVHFDHLIIDRKRQRVRVLTDARGEATLRAAGLDSLQLDLAGSARLHGFERARLAALRAGAESKSIPGFACYRTVEETYATMDALKAAHPNLVAIDTLGPSWQKTRNPAQGYDLRALRITNFDTLAADPQRPVMVVFSSIHAREYAPAELNTRFGEWLVDHYGSDPEATWLVDHNDFRLILEANPDARKVAEQWIYQRKNLDTVSAPCSGSPTAVRQGGVDLNRNFPFHWNIVPNDGGSSSLFCDQTYRGPTPASEPETQHLLQYVAGQCNAAGECSGGAFADRRTGPMRPTDPGADGNAAAADDTTGFFVDIHSNASMILWPWGDTADGAPNQTALRTLGRRIGWFNGYTPQQSDTLYPTDGTTDDTMYGLLGVPAYTIELDGVDFFQPCSAFLGSTLPDNLAALRYIARSLHAGYRLPAGPDALAVTLGSDLVVAGDALTVSARIDDTRFNQSTLVDPTPGIVRDIGGARMSLDQLPWQAGNAALALTATDGAFDAPAETVSGVIDTHGLAAGRHFVHVQGSDATGVAGTPNAAQFDIVDGASVGTLEGLIRDRVTLAPLAAQLTLGSDEPLWHGHSDASLGHYRMYAYPGTHTLQVSAPHYLSETIVDLPLAAGAHLERDFELLPSCRLIDDDVENGNSGWTTTSSWTIQDDTHGHGGHVWHSTNTGDDTNAALTSTSLNLSGYDSLVLSFDDRCATEVDYDFGYVEYSTNAGRSWNPLYRCSGRTDWRSHQLALPDTVDDSHAFMLRWRLNSEEQIGDEGWSIDNLRLEAGGAACRAQWNSRVDGRRTGHSRHPRSGPTP